MSVLDCNGEIGLSSWCEALARLDRLDDLASLEDEFPLIKSQTTTIS